MEAARERGSGAGAGTGRDSSSGGAMDEDVDDGSGSEGSDDEADISYPVVRPSMSLGSVPALVRSVDFSPDGKIVVGACADCLLVRWDLARGAGGKGSGTGGSRHGRRA